MISLAFGVARLGMWLILIVVEFSIWLTVDSGNRNVVFLRIEPSLDVLWWCPSVVPISVRCRGRG